MPQTQGAGTVSVGGPGSTLRGPLYVRNGNGNLGQYSSVKVLDDTGILTGLALGWTNIVVTSAQLKALNTTPIKIISAAGAGTLVEVVRIIAELKYGTATYANGGALSIKYGASGPALATTIPAALVTGAADTIWMSPESLTTQQLSSAILNTDIYLSAASADFITGDGTVILRVWTRTHTGL